MRFVYIAVDALRKACQRRAEGKYLFRLPAVLIEEMHPGQRAELQLVEMRGKARAHRLVTRRIFVDILQKVGHPLVGGRIARVKIPLDDLPRDGEGRLRLGHGGGKRIVACHIACVLIDDRVVLMLDRHGAQDMAAFARHIHLGDGGAHPDRDRVCGNDPLLDRVGKNNMKVRPLFRQRLQRGGVPLAGVAAVDQLDLGMLAQIFIEPAQCFLHRDAVCFGKAGKVGACHLGKLGYLLLAHAGIAEA